MQLLYGKPIAQGILNQLKDDILLCERKPGLAVILVGNESASKLYVSLKKKTASEIGMNFYSFKFSEDISQEEILQQIDKLNDDENVSGIIVQLPLPIGFETEKIISSIEPRKDVDGFHHKNIENFLQGRGDIEPVFPKAIAQLIKSSGEDLKNKKAVVIANSNEFGKIMCTMLECENIISQYFLTENILLNLGQIKDADIVVSAVGSPGLLKGEMLKEGSIVIDGGIEKVGEKVLGDVDFGSTEELSGYITPVPGGVGPVTIACLLENTYLAFKAQ